MRQTPLAGAFIPPTRQEVEDARDWDALVRDLDGQLPDLPTAELLRQFREYRENQVKPSHRWPPLLWLIGISILFGLALTAFALITLVSLMVTKAHAQTMCSPTEDLETQLGKQYGEEISGAGMSIGEGGAYEVFAAPDGKTFTIVRIDLGLKMACIIGAGHNWAQIPYVPHGPRGEKL